MVGKGFRVTKVGYGRLKIRSYRSVLSRRVTELGYGGLRYINGLPKWVMVG